MALPLGDKEDGFELKLTFDGEMLDGEVFLPVVCQTLVEGYILFRGDVLRVPRPDGLGLVELLVFDGCLLDLLLWLVVVDLLDFSPLFATLFDLFVIVDLLNEQLAERSQILHASHLLNFLRDSQLDGVRDELGVLLDNTLDPLLLEVLKLIIFQVESDLCATSKWKAVGIRGNREGSSTGRFPGVLFVVVVLRHNLDAFGNEVCRVKPNTELSDHRDVGATAYGLHEPL